MTDETKIVKVPVRLVREEPGWYEREKDEWYWINESGYRIGPFDSEREAILHENLNPLIRGDVEALHDDEFAPGA